jgi:hypothetical protein
MGVWGFVGKNQQGGITTLIDWRDIALNNREVIVVYDNDVMVKRSVQQALDVITEFLRRRGSKVGHVYLPAQDGKKVGIDDYLLSHSLEEALSLAQEPEMAPKLTGGYRIENGCICQVRIERGGVERVAPLGNFVARVVEDVTKDDGIEPQHYFAIEGQLASGESLPRVFIPASSFSSLNWVVSNWGIQAVISAGQSAKDRLREAIQLLSQRTSHRVVYCHTGWRESEPNKWLFLSAGSCGIEVELPPALAGYCLPEKAEEARETVQASLRLLEVAPYEITIPLLAAPYTAVLSEVIQAVFALYLYGTTGSLKTTLACLAISHFGTFSTASVPATWEATENYLERLASQAKDVLLLIDDFYPQPTESEARNQERKAQRLIRAQSSHVGRGRMRPDTSLRPAYSPRGVILSTGELIPSGQSTNARFLVIEVSRDQINLEKLTAAQAEAHRYPQAMRSFVDWLAPQLPDLKQHLLQEVIRLRDKVRKESQHLRVPEMLAQLLVGWDMMLQHAVNVEAIGQGEADSLLRRGFEVIIKLGEAQANRILEEKPTRRFLDILQTLFTQKRAYLRDKKGHNEPTNCEQWGWVQGEERAWPAPGADLLGWIDAEESILYLLSEASYRAVTRFARESGEPLTITKRTLHMQLRREGVLIPVGDRAIYPTLIGGTAHRVIKLTLDSWSCPTSGQ